MVKIIEPLKLQKYCSTLTFPDSKTLSLQLTSILPVTCCVAVLWPELWLQLEPDHCGLGCSGVTHLS